MCVIILRNPGVSIPFEKIQSACIVNPDGWGVAIADRGLLTIRKGLEEKTNPEMIYKILEDAKDQPLMLHLRYVTAGERTLANCHPFQVLSFGKSGIDMAFCHNGTLYEWKETGSQYSDSYWLNEKLVKPLYERVAAYTGPKNALRDEFAINLLEETVGNNSLFGLIDGNGLQLAINHGKGKDYDGWWASNEYSFDKTHREPAPTTSSGYYPSYGTGAFSDDQEEEMWKAMGAATPANDVEPGKVIHIGHNNPPFQLDEEVDDVTEEDEEELAEMEELLEQGEMIKGVLDGMTTKRMNPNLVKACLQKTAPTFVEICKIDDLREMTRFDPEDICELAVFYPEAAAVLIKDLLYELYFKNLAAKKSENAQAAARALAARKNKEAAA